MRRQGFTLVEVVFAAGVLVVAILGLFSVFITSDHAAVAARERGVALRAIEQQLERLRPLTLVNAYATPRGFAVSGFMVQPGDPDNLPGFIWFPGDDSTSVSAVDRARPVTTRLLPGPAAPANFVREDLNFPLFGLPFDMNANGQIDPGPYRGPMNGARPGGPPAPVVLPVVVVVEWRGQQGSSRLAMPTTLGSP